MLDINFIRENVEKVKDNCQKRGCKINVDELIKIDEERRKLIQEVDSYRGIINQSSKAKPSTEEIAELKKTKVLLQENEHYLKEIENHFFELMSWIPNMSSPEMPVGLGEEDNVEIKIWLPDQGYLPKEKLGKGNNAVKYMPVHNWMLHHQELGEKLDIIDNKQSAITSGSRFYYLKNKGVLLEYALFQFLMKRLLEEDFTPMIVPLLVKERVLFGTSHFPEGKEQIYKIESNNVEEKTDLFLVGSTEPPLFGYFMDKMLQEKDLPQKVFAVSPCFRSEVGSWGKDVRGIKRVHQFDKLEMDIVSTPEQSKVFVQLRLCVPSTEQEP